MKNFYTDKNIISGICAGLLFIILYMIPVSWYIGYLCNIKYFIDPLMLGFVPIYSLLLSTLPAVVFVTINRKYL